MNSSASQPAREDRAVRRRRNAELAAAVCRFNYFPSVYTDASWLNDLPGGAVVVRLRTIPRVQQRLSAYLLENLLPQDTAAGEGSFDFDFSEPYRRLALLPGQQIGRLIVYTGLAVDNEYIQRIILRDELRRLKEAITEEGYSFATKRAPYIGPVHPGLRGPDSPQGEAEALFRHFLAAGARCLSIAFEQTPPGVMQRLRLKLPRDWGTHFPPRACAPCSEEIVNAARDLLIKVAAELELDP